MRDKTILITGASSGLGHGLARHWAGGGNRLVVTARREPELEALAAEVRASGSACLVAPADATDAGACVGVLEAARDAFGPIDVAVLNAGGGRALSMADATVEQVVHMHRVNYLTLVHFLFPLIEAMKARPRDHARTIAFTGSPAGYFGLPKSGAYSASKAAARVLFDTCRIELADTGIRFVALYPGFTDTPGLDASEVPSSALIIPPERAVREMARAIERGRAHHMFPKRIRLLMTLARLLPEPVRRAIFRRVS